MQYLPHQEQMGAELYSKVLEYGFAILAAEERTGKTGTFINAMERSKAERVLILTKKAAIAGIEAQILGFRAKKLYTVTNYQSIHKLPHTNYDVIILDEFHQALCAYPKPSETSKAVRQICEGKPIIFVSATPFAESYAQSFWSLNLSDYSPFKDYKNFYAWHKVFGIDTEIRISGRAIKQYNYIKDAEVKAIVAPYVLKISRLDVGFEHEPDDRLHIVELNNQTISRMKQLKADKMLEFVDLEPYIADSSMGMANALYQLSGGGLTMSDGYKETSTEKIDYIKANFDDNDTAIMCHYVGEQNRLKQYFKNVFSSTADAEGVDLSHFKHLVVYSMSFSASKYIQRRCRQCNINRKEPITVHFLIADYGIDEHIYSTVATKKTNFTARVYNEREQDTKKDN